MLRAAARAEDARLALEKARLEAQSLGSRRTLWPILAELAELEAERGDQPAALELRRRAAEVIDYIAGHAGSALQQAPRIAYGVERRRVRVINYRGKTFRGGNHDYVIRHGGSMVYPRLVASEHRGHPDRTRMPTGVGALDALWRRHRAQHQHADRRGPRHRQVVARRTVRGVPRASAAKARRCSSSTRASKRCSRARTGWACPAAGARGGT